MTKASLSAIEHEELQHNLLGQRLGRKGRDTRERILAATQKLLDGPPDTAISLSAVAREASLGMTSLYLYFTDLSELLLAVLGPISEGAEALYKEQLQTYWPDEQLGEGCRQFVNAYYNYWLRHTRILHLRNSLADSNDERMSQYRIKAAQHLMNLFLFQMDCKAPQKDPYAASMASVLVTGLERTITRATESHTVNALSPDETESRVRYNLLAQARLLELGLRDLREMARKTKTKK